MENEQGRTVSFSAEAADTDTRIDLYLALNLKDLTRSRIQSLVKEGNVKVNNTTVKTSYRLKAGDEIILSIPQSSPSLLNPEPLDLSIIYEDSSIIVLEKPPGLVIHPAPGHNSGTLVHGLLYHCDDLSGIGGVLRPGIVHRLDKDTSGLLVVAKNDDSHNILSGQFKNSMINKKYIAIVHGVPEKKEGTIDLPISRHPVKRKEMAVSSKGKKALTIWKILERVGDKFALLSITIKTGRTHQIRVHMSHMGHPVVGDPVYGYKNTWWKRNTGYSNEILSSIKRQMLHSEYLGFIHPDTKEYMEFRSPVPNDMIRVMENLKNI
ncbi:MAG: RluA family pseudouridine synthase [Deltaproteobacteria bacterium]|nr:RluA family pseudouridine synthase [Deltaproteobacteria bacterium]